MKLTQTALRTRRGGDPGGLRNLPVRLSRTNGERDCLTLRGSGHEEGKAKTDCDYCGYPRGFKNHLLSFSAQGRDPLATAFGILRVP